MKQQRLAQEEGVGCSVVPCGSKHEVSCFRELQPWWGHGRRRGKANQWLQSCAMSGQDGRVCGGGS